MSLQVCRYSHSQHLAHFPFFSPSTFFISDTVCGVEECGETVLEIIGAKQQKLSWEGYGFHIAVPDRAVSSDVTISLAVKCILSGQFELPEDAHLVSAIYWVSASEMLQKEVSVHIQHAAIISSEEEASNFKFIVGKCSQKNLPYTFKIISGGFSPQSQLATISVKQFSFFAAIFRGKKKDLKLQYLACTFLKQVYPTNWEFSFLVTVDMEPMLQVCMYDYIM